jgi:hypothetical protein
MGKPQRATQARRTGKGSVNADQLPSSLSEVHRGHPSVESRLRMPTHTHLRGAAVHTPREASHNPLGQRKGKRKSPNADAGKY